MALRYLLFIVIFIFSIFLGSCVQLLDYFPKAISYSLTGDLFIVAVKNEEQQMGDLESDIKRKDEIIKLSSSKRKLERYHSASGSGSWISDLTVLKSDEVLIW